MTEGPQEMKKLLGMALALAISSSAIAANAEILKNLKTTGEITVLGVMDQNVTDLRTDKADDFRHTRSMITYGVMFDLLDDLHANMTFVKSDRFYGQGSQDLNTIQNNIKVEEANVQLDKVAEHFNVKVGRQFYGNAYDLVIFYGTSSPLEEAQGATALDAVRIDLADSEKHNAHLIYAKVAETTPVTATDTGTSLLGIRDAYKMNDDLTLGVYIYNRRIGNATYALHGDNLYVFGLKADGTFMGFGYGVEVIGNAGKGTQVANQDTPTYKGYAYTGKVNYKIESDFGGFNPRIMYAYGSGDNQGLNAAGNTKNNNFTAINPDFRPGLIFGMSDLAGCDFGTNLDGIGTSLSGTYYTAGSLTNLTVMNLGVDYTPKFSEKLSFVVDFFNFKINQDSTGALGDDKNIGSELDLTVNYKFAENVNLGLAGGHFMPGSAVKKITAGSNPANKLASYLTVKW